MNVLSPRLLRSLLVLSAALILVSIAPQLAQAQSTPPTSKAPPPPPPPPATDQQQFVSYWTTETGWRTELQLRNNQVGQILTVTPVLRATDGTETPLFPVVIQPQEVKTLDIATAIGSSAPQLIGAYGSLALRYRAPSQINLYAAAMVMGVGHALAFHVDATGEDPTESVGSREGIWWFPNATASDYLVLTNQGTNPLQTTLSLFDASGKAATQNITLPPRAMNRYSIRQMITSAKLFGSYGGIKVSATTHAGSLDTLHVVFDPEGGFSAIMKMFDYDPSAQLKERDYAGTGVWTLRAPMLALSNPDPALAFPDGTTLHPQLFIHNTTPKIENLSLQFNWHSDAANGQVPATALHLAPYQTQQIDVTSLQSSKAIPAAAHWASVTLTTDGLPDEIVAVAASYDETLKYGSQTPFSDQLASLWAGGHWQYDPQHDSIVTAGNGGTKPTQASFTIFYNQGTQKYELDQTLQPGEQMWMDIGKLIRQNVPDKNGKPLPADLTTGSYEIRDLTNKGIGTLFEGKVIYDKTYGHVVYGCAACCGWTIPFSLWYDPISVIITSFQDDGVTAWYPCESQYDDVSTSFYGGWSSAAPSIVTVDTYGTHHGLAVGSTTSQAQGCVQSNNAHIHCPNTCPTPVAPVNVNPTVAFLGTNNYIFDGGDPTVTPFNVQYVQGNPNGGTYTWNDSTSSSYHPNISINGSAAPYSTTAAQATVTADAPSSALLDTTLTVGYQANSVQAPSPATRAITIRIFRFLQQDGTIQIIPINGSGNPPKYGYQTVVKYLVYTNPSDQLLQPGYSNISVLETVSITSENFPVTLTQGTGGLDNNSEVNDTLAIVGNSPLPSTFSSTADQYLSVGGFFVRHNTLNYTQTAITITNLGPFN